MISFFVLTFSKEERFFMKFIRILGVLLMFVPCVSMAANTDEFQNASKLLTAARRGDVQTVQVLINNGVDVNYVDATGLSLVCTAVMNNDKRAIQILQMYGADASNCDRQIKQYKQKSRVATSGEETGFFSGLSSTHVLALSAVGAAAVIGGVVLLAKVFDNDNDNGAGGTNGDRPNNNNGEGSTSGTVQLFAQNIPNGPGCNGDDCSEYYTKEQQWQDFDYMSSGDSFNYLMVSRAYDAFVRGYRGMSTIRIASDLSPFDLKTLPYPSASLPGGGKPKNVAMITASGVSATGSAMDGLISWIDDAQISTVQSICNKNGSDSSVCQTALSNMTKVAHKYYNYSGASAAETENTSFNLSGVGSVFSSATDEDTKLAKIIAGWEGDERADPDFYGFIPNGQLTAYKIGVGSTGVSDYKNYAAIYDALTLKDGGEYVTNVVANLSLPVESSGLSYATVGDAKILIDNASTDTNKKAIFTETLIDNYYNLNTSDDTGSYTLPSGNVASGKQSDNAVNAFKFLTRQQAHILVNSAGHSLIGLGQNQSVKPLDATFENFAPVVYNDLENLFMTVVAVKPQDGTSEDTITGYTHAGAGTLELSVWTDTTNDYSSRMCGLTGNGNGGAMNPWCFAAPGNTDMEATAAMAGSVALVQSAFDYMTPKQVFLLLALTADGPYLGVNPDTNLLWASSADLITYLRNMYTLPGNLDTSDAQYLESFKTAFGYGMINLERATRPGTNVYFYDSDANSIVSTSGQKAYWGKATNSSRASKVLSLTNRGAITTSFYDVIESGDGTISLPRVWNVALSSNNDYSKHGLYMGDVLGEFDVGSVNKRHQQIGNFVFDMSLSPRVYNDNMNGLDDLHVAFQNEKYDIDAGYQRFLTDGQSRFNGRANGVLSLVSGSVASGAKYKYGNFAFGGRAFSGAITDENLLENDPTVSSQFEPARLGLANGGEAIAGYDNDKFAFNVAVGNLHETNTVLGMYSDGMLTMRGANTQYVDAVAEYKMFDRLKLFARATFANTHVDNFGGIINDISDIKSNAFALGTDFGGFNLTAALPLATVGGKMGYDYAEFDVIENGDKYEIAMNNPHVEYVDLAAQKRELRFSTSYKKSIGEFTDAGVGMIYRVHPNNTDEFGNESIFMFKLHHRLGI